MIQKSEVVQILEKFGLKKGGLLFNRGLLLRKILYRVLFTKKKNGFIITPLFKGKFSDFGNSKVSTQRKSDSGKTGIWIMSFLHFLCLITHAKSFSKKKIDAKQNDDAFP